MPAKPSTNKCDKHNSMVNRHIGTAYDTVKIVADNIEIIEEIGDNLPYLLKYLGAYSTPPTERPDGSPLQDGDYYFDSVSEALVYYKLATDEWFEVDPQEILNARDEAIAARDAAQLAQANAETAEANAEASELAAAQSENNAATSASEAATSESNAATSESNAAGSAADALASENAALASELAAAQSEANASTSESNANLSAQAAATSEANALASETNAAGSAVAAAQSAADAEQAFDNFTDLYLGAKTEDPTTDNDGNPLQVGATYWNIPNTTLLYWSGMVWDSPEETAIQAANTAIAARDDAQISETNAEASADAAALSATDASTSESNAANSASTAQGAATTAGNHATTATNAASAASQSEINAAASELNALASENKAELWAEEDEDVEVEPNRYSAKHWASKAEQEAGVLTWQKHVRTGTDLNQMREQNKDARAASGFDQYGLHREGASGTGAINEGMYQYEWIGSENQVYIGRNNTGTNNGTSETQHPVTCIAGFITEVLSQRQAVHTPAAHYIKFPEAPDGTVIYDSSGDARGTGSPTMNLLTDVERKYGDVAADHNEAVARAFEGELYNGDLRLGSTNWNFGTGWSIDNSTQEIVATNAGVNTITWNPSNVEVGKTYTYHITVNEITQGGFRMYVRGNSGTYYNFIDLKEGSNTLTRTATEAIELIVIYATGGSGSSGRFTGGAIQVATEEVVIDRHDVFGGEFFLEEVSGSNPYVYPKGMIQSQVTDMNGITTVATNRPDTYYAVYAGDTGSNGLGVDFWAATDAEKIAMVSDESNNLFLLSDGRLVQWRMRQRTIAGLSNGDWGNVNPVENSIFIGNRFMSVQGFLDVMPVGEFNDSADSFWAGKATPYLENPELGVFMANNGAGELSDRAVDGECYWHTWGVVRRLNQGAWHPSFNPLGTEAWRSANGYGVMWAGIDSGGGNVGLGAHVVVNAANAFNINMNGHAAGNTANVPRVGTYGNIAGAGSSTFPRDDGRRFDGIYVSGDGGVNDYRLPSWDMSSKEEASKVFQKVVNGTYRGAESLIRTKIYLYADSSAVGSDGGVSTFTKDSNAVLQQGAYGWFNSRWVNDATGTQNEDGFNWNRTINPELDGLRSYAVYVGDNGNTFIARGVNHLYYRSGHHYGVPLGQTVTEQAAEIDKYNAAFPNGTTITVYTVEAEILESTVSGEFDMTDVMGAPDTLLTVPELASGWQGGWIPTIPDSTPRDYPCTRKALESPSQTYQFDRVNDWSYDATLPSAWNSVTNTREGIGYARSAVAVWHYKAWAKQTVESSNQELLNYHEGVGDVYVNSFHGTNYGVFLNESLMGKINTASSSRMRQFLPMREVYTDSRKLYWNSSTYDTANNHAPVALSEPNNDSPALKALWYQVANDQLVSINFAWHELKWGEYSTPFTLTAGQSTVFEAGKTYRLPFTLDNHSLRGAVVMATANRTITVANNWYSTYFIGQDGYFYNTQSGVRDGWFKVAQNSAFPWGDDSSIKPISNTGTYLNENEQRCQLGTATLSKPIGYVKNQARVGTQDEGVDL